MSRCAGPPCSDGFRMRETITIYSIIGWAWTAIVAVFLAVRLGVARRKDS